MEDELYKARRKIMWISLIIIFFNALFLYVGSFYLKVKLSNRITTISDVLYDTNTALINLSHIIDKECLREQ